MGYILAGIAYLNMDYYLDGMVPYETKDDNLAGHLNSGTSVSGKKRVLLYSFRLQIYECISLLKEKSNYQLKSCSAVNIILKFELQILSQVLVLLIIRKLINIY
jgi:hypothetical protein